MSPYIYWFLKLPNRSLNCKLWNTSLHYAWLTTFEVYYCEQKFLNRSNKNASYLRYCSYIRQWFGVMLIQHFTFHSPPPPSAQKILHLNLRPRCNIQLRPPLDSATFSKPYDKDSFFLPATISGKHGIRPYVAISPSSTTCKCFQELWRPYERMTDCPWFRGNQLLICPWQ